MSAERSKIDDLAVLPPQDPPALWYSQERVYPAVFGEPDNLTGVIAPDGEAVDTARQRAEIPERPSPPAESVEDEALGIAGVVNSGIGEPDNHSRVIDEGKFHGLRAVGAAESAKVDEPVAKALGGRYRLFRRGGTDRERGRSHDRHGDDRRNLGFPSSGRCAAGQESPGVVCAHPWPSLQPTGRRGGPATAAPSIDGLHRQP